MKECKWCHEEMKEEAIVCPHCQKKQTSSKGLWLTLGIIAVLIITAVGLSSGFNIGGLEISNSKIEVSQFGALTFTGDVTNVSEYRRENVKIILTCYSDSREKVGYANTVIKYIEPNETIHFNATGLGNYNVEAECEYEIK